MNNVAPFSTTYISSLFEDKLFFVLFVCLFYIGYSSDHLYLIFCNRDEHIDENIENEKKDEEEIIKEEKTEVTYEKKYIEKLNSNKKKDFEYNNDDIDLIDEKYNEYCKEFEIKKKDDMQNIYELILKLKERINNINNGLVLENEYDDCYDTEDSDETNEELNINVTEKIKQLTNKLKDLNNKLSLLETNSIDHEVLKKKAFDNIREIKLKALLNNYILENTPLGNVSMRYNADTQSFEYHSNNTLPYRFLETVCRKYVLTYRCTFLYVDVEEELKRCEIKQEDIKKEEIKKKEEDDKNGITNDKKKLFAKLKNYNSVPSNFKESIAAPINRQSTSQTNTSSNNNNLVLKENANRYTWKGRFSNFDILKKVDKNLVNKNAKLTFSDFKKMKQL